MRYAALTNGSFCKIKNSNHNMNDLMDVTLRDGSYEVGFKFTSDDVSNVGRAVEAAGIKYIEIGHGQGLSASSAKYGIAANSDEEYLIAASENLKHIKYGMFCIPGIARVEDIDILAKYNASFIRIGCNTTPIDVANTQKYVERAKKLGLTVFANYMKTYVADDNNFRKCVKMSVEYGADVLVIVDSAGCMLPSDISHYYNIIKETSKGSVSVGFHGHDNLGLSVYNSLHALSIGCDIVDSSLQSLGRGAGNASTEQMIAILSRLYPTIGYSLSDLMRFSEDYLRPKVKFKGVSGLDTYCGIAGFHSGYMNSIRKFAEQYAINPYTLILEYCKVDRIGMNEHLLENIAKSLA